MSAPCSLCDKKTRIIHEFQHSILTVGDHQLFPGYCVLISKIHAREPFDLPSPAREEIYAELLISARAIQEEFRPWKMNYSCYGNQVPHVHWHLFPRYESDPLRLQPPWAQAGSFSQHATTLSQASDIIARLRARVS